MSTRRIFIDIEKDEHKYLKMCCAKLGITIKQFVISATIEKVDAYEDKWMLERWERDGTREEIERERKDVNRTSYQLEKVDGRFLFTEMKGVDFNTNVTIQSAKPVNSKFEKIKKHVFKKYPKLFKNLSER